MSLAKQNSNIALQFFATSNKIGVPQLSIYKIDTMFSLCLTFVEGLNPAGPIITLDWPCVATQYNLNQCSVKDSVDSRKGFKNYIINKYLLFLPLYMRNINIPQILWNDKIETRPSCKVLIATKMFDPENKRWVVINIWSVSTHPPPFVARPLSGGLKGTMHAPAR